MTVTINGSTGVNIGAGNLTFPDDTTQSSSPIGVGQTWQNVTGSRSYSTTYTNSTGKPILVSVIGNGVGTVDFGTTLTLTISGIAVLSNSSMNRGSAYATGVNGIVPAGATYSVTANNGSLNTWAELR